MKILPREHGATVIWFVSVLASILVITALPSPAFLILFLAVSIAVLLSAGQLTSHSRTLVRIQRNRFFLPILSSSLTLIMPLGEFIMFGGLSARVFAAWLLLFTYTVVSVSLIQLKVQGFLKGKEVSSKRIVVPGLAVLAGEGVLLASAGIMHPAVILSLTPLLVMWIYLSRRRVEEKSNRVKMIKRVGFQQTGNMIAFILILAIVTRL
ncbi:MAG: hypothetical protein HYY22_04675 [Thaumarchaeota archaeon]|nr:hypothetical protein [Nitrososphaerota archaeon]